MTGDDVRGLIAAAHDLEPRIQNAVRALAESAENTALEVERERAETAEQIRLLNARNEDLAARLVVAQRNKDRFRYALWLYLQERDGPAGTGAPTPETLKLIRKVIEELE